MYRVFVRNWWKSDASWPNGLAPNSSARKTTIARRVASEHTAREIAKQYNKSHNPGKFSRKAEYEET